MAQPNSRTFTMLLDELKLGKKEAGDELMSMVYQELRMLARYYMRRERPDHTLQATALVNEVYVDLFGSGERPLEFEDRAHFLAVASKQMRRILVDHARRHNAQIRGSGNKVPLDNAGDPWLLRDKEFTYLDDALTALEKTNPRAFQVVELCFFGGCTQQEAAESLGISLATIQRDWEFAKGYLYKQLAASDESPGKASK